jgi:hypothetical protein
MKTKNIILLFFATLTILVQSCNSDKEIVEGLKNRILKINTLINSQNKGTYYLNILDDSINIIKFDISTAKIKDENKVIVSKLLDSISNNILIVRLNNCIIGEHYSISSSTWKQMLKKVTNLPIGQGVMDAYTEGLNKELSLNNITITVYIKENNKCEIVTSYYSAMANLTALYFGGLLGNMQKPAKKEIGTYKYIGDNTFEISNKMILKIKDKQNCKAELSIKIPTEEEIRNANSKNRDTLLVNKESDSKPIPSSPVKIQMLDNSIRIGNLEVAQSNLLPLMNWSDAKNACSRLGKGFRLPTKNELNLIYQNRSKLNGYGNLYFSSTEPEYNPNSVVWIQNFDGGEQGYGSKFKEDYFFAVRSL